MRNAITLVLLVVLSSCQQANQKELTKSYFDLAGFFKQEATRLQMKNQPIGKSVVVNGKTEEKQVIIKNWERELNAFASADINKPAWRGEFEILSSESNLTYTTNNSKISVKKLEIEKVGTSVKRISIVTAANNMLYTTTDTLLYVVDSIYEIKSNQKIQLLKPKNYRVTGKFNL